MVRAMRSTQPQCSLYCERAGNLIRTGSRDASPSFLSISGERGDGSVFFAVNTLRKLFSCALNSSPKLRARSSSRFIIICAFLLAEPLSVLDPFLRLIG